MCRKRQLVHCAVFFAVVHLLCTASVATVRPRQGLASGPILVVHILGAAIYVAALVAVIAARAGSRGDVNDTSGDEEPRDH